MRNRKRTHHSQTVCLWIGSCILHHVSVGHPLGENEEREQVRGHRDSQQREDVRMGQIFPTNDLSTQPLSEG